MGKSGKLFSILMSIILIVGLMPAPAFADSSLRAGGFAEPQEEATEPESSPLQEAADAAGSALSSLGANVMGAISALGNVQDDPVVLDSGTCGENLTWEYWDDARLVISGTGEMDDYTAEGGQPWNKWLTIIEKIVVDEGVASIGDYAFYKCIIATDVELHDGLLKIGSYAFAGQELIESFDMPDTVTEIGTHMLDGLGSVRGGRALTTVHLSSSLADIPAYTFHECRKLQSVNIPFGVEHIGRNAFYFCTLPSLELPHSLKRLDPYAFYAVTVKSDLVIPNSIDQIFESGSPFAWMKIQDGITFESGLNQDVVFSRFGLFTATTARWVKIPGDFDSIQGFGIAGINDYFVDADNPNYAAVDGVLYSRKYGNDVFDEKTDVLFAYPGGREDVTEFDVPEGVKVVASAPPLVEKMAIPSSVVNIVSFSQTTLKEINVSEDNDVYSSSDGVLFSKDKSVLYRCPAGYEGAYIMPSSVETLVRFAFSNCAKVPYVAISEKVTSLPELCFASCGLESCFIPRGVTTIEEGCFRTNCNTNFLYGGLQSEWESVDWKSVIYTTDDGCIVKDTARVRFDIIRGGYSNDGLTYCLDGQGTFTLLSSPNSNNPQSMCDYSGQDAPWADCREAIKSLVVEDGVSSIGASAFEGCSALETVELPSSIVEVGGSAFRGCAALGRVSCEGDPFVAVARDQEDASFTGNGVVLHYSAGRSGWESDAAFDGDKSEWHGYKVEKDALPILKSATLGKYRASVTGYLPNPDVVYGKRRVEEIPLECQFETTNNLTGRVSVAITSPERQKAYSGWVGVFDEMAHPEWFKVDYSEDSGCIEVGQCALAGKYTFVVTPLEEYASGGSVVLELEVVRSPEKVYEGTGWAVTAGGCAKDGTVHWATTAISVSNQYGEDVTDECSYRYFDKLNGEDVTEASAESGYWFEGKTVHYSNIAVTRSFDVEITGATEDVAGSCQCGVSVSRSTKIINIPFMLNLTGGEKSVQICADGQWSSVPYRVRVVDAYLDPCWPELTWSVADSSGADVSQYFKVDAQGYLFVDAGVRDILAEGDNQFTVKCTAGEASDTAPLTIRLAPEEVAPATHTATFKAGDEVVGEIVFAEGDTSLEEPSVPQRENYIGAWEEYDLASVTGDITVNAVYSPIDPDAVSEVSGEAEATYDKSVVTINLAAAAATRQVKVESEATKPVDVVMVLDQSGSMADKLGAGQTKRDALVECANTFAQQLYANAEKTGADHRVALVGFAYSAYNNGRYKNTGLLAGANGAKNYSQLSRADYAGALLPVKGDGGINPAVTAGIDSIVADGATAADVGLKVAKNVFSENPVATAEDGTPERERVVVFITDGVPTSWGQTSSLVRETAAEAILMARDIKQGQGARVYSVGVDAAADPAAAFNNVADGVVTGARDAFKSYDFNRFLHAVSSDYPVASGMADLGDGSRDAGYYMAVNDTSSLGKIFSTILYSTVYSIETFDRATLSYALPDGFVLTMRQEEEMRAALAEQGLSDDDIIVTTSGDGKTTVAFRNVAVRPETVNGVVKYVARVCFQVTAGKDASGEVAAGSAAVEQNGETASIEVPTVEVPDDRCLVVFKVNDAVYEIREATIGDEIELPDTNLARWLDLEKMQEQGTAQVSGAYAVFETSTLTRTYNVNWTVGENSLTTSFQPGAAVEVPAEVMAWVPDGFELAGWSPVLPATMPARNLSATAVLTPKHVHDYSHSTYQTGSCDEGIVTHRVCVCGEEETEQAAAKAHDYEAVLSSGGMYGTTVEKLVCKDCGHSVDKHITYTVSRSSFWNATVLDLSKYEGEVVRDGASDDDISLRFYVGETAGKTYTVTRIDADGKKTSYTTRVENGYLTFDPDHFSIYVVGEGGGQDDGLTYERALEALGNGELPEVTGDPESVKEAPDVISIAGAAIAPIPGQEYDGTEKRPAVSVSLDGETLTADDYGVEYANNVNAGTASVTVTGKGDYEGEASATFEIKRKPVTVRALDASKTYGEADPAVEVEKSGLIGTDEITYEVSREPGENAGEYAITPSGETEQGNYAIEYLPGKLTVNPRDISGAEVALSKASYTYSGAVQKPTVEAVGGKVLKASDCQVAYSNSKSVNAGTYTVTVTGQGNYGGTASATYEIKAASIKGAKLTLSKSAFTYNKKAQRPTVKTVGGKALKAGTDYDLKYSNAKSTKAGSYTVQAVGKGNYAGASAKATYKILNANPVKVTARKPVVSLAKVKKAKQVVAAKNAFAVSGNKGGKVTYKKASGDKALMVASNGKVTIAKGAKKGLHTAKVTATIAAKGNYAAATKTVTLKVTVK